MSTWKNGRAALLGALMALPMLACGPDYDHLELSGTKASPLGGEVKDNHISVPEGMIVKTHVVPWNDDKETMPGHVFSHDSDTLEIAAIVNDRDYAFIEINRRLRRLHPGVVAGVIVSVRRVA